MNRQTEAPSRPAGRPREFDVDAALDVAIAVFSERGYHGTSIADLTSAMGVTAGSLYKAFKDKHAIFVAAFDRYKALRNALLLERVATGATGREKIREILGHYGDSACGESGRRGCLVVGAAVELSLFDAEIAERVAHSREGIETLFGELVRLGQSDGSVSSGIDADAAACVLYSFTQGLRVIGKLGEPPEKVEKAIVSVMAILD